MCTLFGERKGLLFNKFPMQHEKPSQNSVTTEEGETPSTTSTSTLHPSLKLQIRPDPQSCPRGPTKKDHNSPSPLTEDIEGLHRNKTVTSSFNTPVLFSSFFPSPFLFSPLPYSFLSLIVTAISSFSLPPSLKQLLKKLSSCIACTFLRRHTLPSAARLFPSDFSLARFHKPFLRHKMFVAKKGTSSPWSRRCRGLVACFTVGPPTAFPRTAPVYRGCPAWTHL